MAKCVTVVIELLHYLVCFLYVFVLLYICDEVMKVKDMWDLQLQLKDDRDNLANCLGENPTDICMKAGDYKLFSYYWFFRLEAYILGASMISVAVFVIIKLITNKTIGGFALKVRTYSQNTSNDLLTREHFLVRKVQEAFMYGVIGLAQF